MVVESWFFEDDEVLVASRSLDDEAVVFWSLDDEAVVDS